MDQQAKNDRLEYEQQSAGASSAATSAQQVASQKLSERLENPEFFAQLRDLDLDTQELNFVEDLFGPLGSGAHLIANRSEEYETEARWLDRNRAERMITERSAGRLCKGKTLEIAQKVHNNPHRDKRGKLTSDQRRAVRDGMEAVTNYKSLGINTAGLSSVTEATAVSRVEKSEEENQSRTERAANLL